ncbi:MAG: DNA-3-methyladenine glycosylase I [Planctomycetota bacterium]|jgi:DNA-3-methyladenine glycosylase I
MSRQIDKPRCPWAKRKNPLYVAYHDEEWGVSRPLSDDDLFELLALEGFQAGLSWETILNKRENFRRAFRGFRIDSVARMGAKDVARLMTNEGIVRNRRKIEATLGNAKVLRGMARRGVRFSSILEPFRPPRRGKPLSRLRDVPAFTDESKALSKALKDLGFAFVGPTVVYSFMQAAGMVNDHLASCFRAPGRGQA